MNLETFFKEEVYEKAKNEAQALRKSKAKLLICKSEFSPNFINSKKCYLEIAAYVHEIGIRENVPMTSIRRGIVMAQMFYCYHKFEMVNFKFLAPSALLVSMKLEKNYISPKSLIRRYNSMHLFCLENLLIGTLMPANLFYFDDFEHILEQLCQPIPRHIKDNVERIVNSSLIFTTIGIELTPTNVVTTALQTVQMEKNSFWFQTNDKDKYSIDIVNASNTCNEYVKKDILVEAMQKEGIFNSTSLEFKCQICHSTYETEKELRDHCIKNPNSCCKCGKTFKLKKYKKAHLEKSQCAGKRSIRVQPFTCEYCKKTFAKKNSLQTHKNTIHLGLKKLVCPFCMTSFLLPKQDKNKMLKHIDKMHKLHPSLFNMECIYCGENLSNLDQLINHVNDTHQFEFACEYCEKTFATLSNKNRHVETIHNRQILKCPSCIKTYSRSDTLQEHVELCHSYVKKATSKSLFLEQSEQNDRGL